MCFYFAVNHLLLKIEILIELELKKFRSYRSHGYRLKALQRNNEIYR